jgi:hypothetical protein
LILCLLIAGLNANGDLTSALLAYELFMQNFDQWYPNNQFAGGIWKKFDLGSEMSFVAELILMFLVLFRLPRFGPQRS